MGARDSSSFSYSLRSSQKIEWEAEEEVGAEDEEVSGDIVAEEDGEVEEAPAEMVETAGEAAEVVSVRRGWYWHDGGVLVAASA